MTGSGQCVAGSDVAPGGGRGGYRCRWERPVPFHEHRGPVLWVRDRLAVCTR